MTPDVPAPFETQPLRAGPWWRRLLRLPWRENPAIELENLLARGLGGVAEISRVLRPYRLTGGEVRDLLNHAYTKALVHFLADEQITEQEHQFLGELRRRLSLSDMEVAEIQASTIHPRYERALKAVLADAHVTAREREDLGRIQANLRLPENVRQRIYTAVAGATLQRSIAAALGDRRLSPEEETDLKAIADNLGLAPNPSLGSLGLMQRFRLLWRIENGDIPPLPVKIHLEKDETCHFQASTDWRELRTAMPRLDPALTGNTPIVRGMRFSKGTLAPAVARSETLTQIDSGTLYMTNQRLRFDGATNNRSIQLNKVLSFQVFSDAIVVEQETGRSPYLFMKGDMEMAATILGAVLQRA